MSTLSSGANFKKSSRLRNEHSMPFEHRRISLYSNRDISIREKGFGNNCCEVIYYTTFLKFSTAVKKKNNVIGTLSREVERQERIFNNMEYTIINIAFLPLFSSLFTHLYVLFDS